MVGMFIFGGKKKEEKKKLPPREYELLQFVVSTGGTVHILSEVTGRSREEIMQNLDADVLMDRKIYIRSHRKKMDR